MKTWASVRVILSSAENLMWSNFSDEFSSTGIIFHYHCPTDYCLDRKVALNRSSPDAQCVLHIGLGSYAGCVKKATV